MTALATVGNPLAFSTQWSDAALAARDSKANKSEAMSAAVDNFDLSGLSEAASRIGHSISWSDVDQQNDGRMIVEMMTMNTVKTMLGGTRAAVTMSWKNQHSHWILRQTTQNFLNSVMATWKTLVHPHLKCMHLQVAVFNEHVSTCLVTRVSEATFLLLALALLTAWFSHAPTANMLSLAARARRARRKERRINTRVEILQTLVHLESCQNTDLTRPPMSNKRPTETGTIRGGTHHAPRLRPDQCTLCRHVGHPASECPNKGKSDFILTWQACIQYLRSGLCCVRCVCYGATVEETEDDEDPNDIEDFVAFPIKSAEGFAILDGGTTKTVLGFTCVSSIAGSIRGYHD